MGREAGGHDPHTYLAVYVQTNAPERPQHPLSTPTIIDHAGAQTKANPNSPSHSPAPTLTAQAMHGDDEHHPALHSTFDPALFDQLVYACVKRVPRGRVTTYGKSAASRVLKL